MTINPNFIDKAFIFHDENGDLETSIFTPPDMIEEIKGINEDYKKLYETDDDLIKIIDYDEEEIEAFKKFMPSFRNKKK
ncbi:hypothetical protein [uncultured Brachyspira sp.]|uniref:hypothetical protein n=1 Tax=uncultured Brachyspira sp. TaxID=221953 RepID=UPI002613E0A8|nr:hypothetical protein [uncultured Brachyspira sp.]